MESGQYKLQLNDNHQPIFLDEDGEEKSDGRRIDVGGLLFERHHISRKSWKIRYDTFGLNTGQNNMDKTRRRPTGCEQ